MSTRILLAIAFTSVLGLHGSVAACNISDAMLEEAILKKPELRNPANRKMVKDLRSLRDAAFVLWSYGLDDDCERLIGNLRELIASRAPARRN